MMIDDDDDTRWLGLLKVEGPRQLGLSPAVFSSSSSSSSLSSSTLPPSSVLGYFQVVDQNNVTDFCSGVQHVSTLMRLYIAVIHL